MTNSILKNRDIALVTKVHIVKAMLFPVVNVWMWELDCKESWTLKNGCFWTVVLEKTLESPLDWRRSNKSILKEISPGCSLVRLMLKLKSSTLATSCKELTHWKRPWHWEGLGGRRRRGRQRLRWLDVITNLMDISWVNSRSWWWTGRPGVLGFMGSQRVRHDWGTALNWTDK